MGIGTNERRTLQGYSRVGMLALATLVYVGSARAQKAAMAKPIGSFAVSNEAGQTANIGKERGKVVFVNFWSLTCVPCKAEMPTINTLQQHYAGRSAFAVYAVDLDRNFTEDARYFTRKNMQLQAWAPAGVVPSALFNGVLPTTSVIDKQGRVVYYHEGGDQYDQPSFYHFIDSLLAQ